MMEVETPVAKPAATAHFDFEACQALMQGGSKTFFAASRPLALTDPAAWQRCFEVNVFGVFNSVRAALPEITRRKGVVLVSASASSFAHPPALSAYAASKAAVEALCNSWRIELAAHGVAVSVIHAS